jgi:sugar lactone lactonase YvrE
MKNLARLALFAFACLIFGSVSVEAQNITTLVGGGPVGLSPTVASVGSPVAVRPDSLGNAYILDNTLGRVLKIDHTTGLISVFAGNGTVGFSGDNGPAVNAQLNGPSGMCIDSHDNVFIADSDNAVIRVVIGPSAVKPPSIPGAVTAGNIYTAVGIQTSTNPVFGGDTTPALSSHLHFPDGCSFDSNGNLYIADRGNNEIRVVLSAAGAAAPPVGLGAGPLTAGNIYRFAGAAGGSFPTPPAGGYAPDGSAAVTGAIYGPFDVVVNTATNDVYIADLGNNFGPDGTPNTQVGQPVNNNVVRIVSGTTGLITTVAGVQGVYSGSSLTGPNPPVASGVATAVALNEPKGLTIDASGNLYFCDALNQVIRKVSGGNISVIAGSLLQHGYSGDGHAATSATLTFPAGTYIDASGNLLISDVGSNAVRIVPTLANSGSFLLNNIYTVAGNGHLSFGGDTANAASAELNTPTGLTLDKSGSIFIADSGSDVIRKVTGSTGIVSTIAGQPEANGFLNTPSTLNVALGAATDAAGNVYIADSSNCIVRKLSTTGITTIAGVQPTIVNPDNAIANVPTCGFTAPGSPATSTKLGTVQSVALDSHGNVYFSDKTNNVIWRVTGTGTGNAAVVAGTQTAGFAGDGGPASAALLNAPTGIYIDIYDNLFIADAGNHRIREVPAVNVGTTMTAGSIYTIAGNGTSGSSGDNAVATGAELAAPFAIVVDNTENVYFSDSTNQTIRKIAGTNAIITTIAGTNGVADFGGDGGAATAAKFNTPTGLALQPNLSPSTTANLLVSDSTNNRVRSIAGIADVSPVALASLSPNPVTFTAVAGTASPASVVTLTNGGGAVLTVTGVSISGTNASDFMETDNCTTPGTVAAGGTCTINVIFSPPAGVTGSRTATLTVTDNAFGGSQSVTLNGTVGTPVLTLTITDTDPSSTQTVTAGATATYNLSVAGNLPVTATITCTGAPTDATCTPAPASVAVTATTAGTLKVSVTTTARGEMLPFNQPSIKMQPPSFLQIAPMASLAFLLVVAMMLGWMQNQPSRMRLARVALSLCLILMPIAAATILVGCGGGGSTTPPPPPPPATGTPAGTYTITVTATSGSTTNSVKLTLIVN